MDTVDRVRAALRKQADEAVAECLAGIKRVRDEHLANAARLRASIEEDERAIAEFDKWLEQNRR